MPTKPVIKYQAARMPLDTALNSSIACMQVSSTENRNWNNKAEFTDYVDQLYVPPSSDTYVYIICQCGAEFVYATKADVPSSNVVCDCGRKVLIYGS